MTQLGWGRFGSKSLDGLRDLLERVDYASLCWLPWFQSRHWQPGLDLLWRLQSQKPALASHSHPHSHWTSFSPELSRTQRLFWQHAKLSARELLDVEALDSMLSDEMLSKVGQNEIESLVQVAVIANRLEKVYFSLSSVARRSPGDFVYLGDDTGLLLAKAEQLLEGRPKGGRLLDICCGSGTISLGLSDYFEATQGSDLNRTAINLAESAAQLNQLHQTGFVCGRSYEAVQGKFDWIVGNPPALPGVGKENLYAFGGTTSTQITEELVAYLPEVLNPGGQALFLTFSPERLLFQKLAAKLPTGFSLNYQVRRRFHGPWKDCRWIDHVWVHLVGDGRARVNYANPPWFEQLMGQVIKRQQPKNWIERLL
jgi:methylase of polypeptide subunit release factors